MHTIILALGANVGNREKNITNAISLLEKKISNIRCAKLYHSKAVGHENQPDFVNTVILAETMLAPEELLEFTQMIEKNIGRKFRFHWGPREIDIDIIFYDNLILDLENLQIPHPRAAERDFVLFPIKEIVPSFVHPVLKKTIAQLCAEIKQSQLSILQ